MGVGRRQEGLQGGREPARISQVSGIRTMWYRQAPWTLAKGFPGRGSPEVGQAEGPSLGQKRCR